LTITAEHKYQVLKSLAEGNKRFRDFLAIGIQKATLAKLLIELEDMQLIQRNVVSTRPYRTDYSITGNGESFLKDTEKQIKKHIELLVKDSWHMKHRYSVILFHSNMIF